MEHVRVLTRHIIEIHLKIIHIFRCSCNNRVLIVYPWTQRYFGSFGDVSTPAAIMGNPKVAAHGKVVCGALDKAVKNMGNILATYKSLSETHANKLFVDPDNFRVCLLSWEIGLYFRLSWCKPTHITIRATRLIPKVKQNRQSYLTSSSFVFCPQVLADVLTIVIAAKFGASFTPEIQATWQKFMKVVVAAMGSRYF